MTSPSSCSWCWIDNLLYGVAYFEVLPDGTHAHYSPPKLRLK